MLTHLAGTELVQVQEKMVWSFEVRMISLCNLVKDFGPSPYSDEMLTSKKPNMQGAMSSIRLTSLPARHPRHLLSHTSILKHPIPIEE